MPLAGASLLVLCFAAPAPQDVKKSPDVPAPQDVEKSPDVPATGRSDRRSVEIYDVRDLVLPAQLRRIAGELEAVANNSQSHAAAEIATLALKLSAARDAVTHDEVASDLAVYDLVQAMVECIGARTHGVDSCQVQADGALTLKATRETHEAVSRTLQKIRRREDAFSIEVRLVEVGPTARERLQRSVQARGDAGSSTGGAVLTPTLDELGELLSDPETNVVAAPAITTLDLDAVRVDVGEQLAYVANFKSIAIEGLGTIADPEVRTIHEGVLIRARGVVASTLPGLDPPPYALRLVVEMTALRRPIATQKTPLGTLQLPELKHATISTTIAGTTDRVVLIGGIQKPSFDPVFAQTRIYALVKVGPPRPR